MPENKAKELIFLFGSEDAFIVATMLFSESYSYVDPYSKWKNDFNEIYTNSERSKYWSEVIECIKKLR